MTPTPKGRNGATGAEDDAAVDATDVESQTITPNRPLQTDFDTYGSASHTEDLRQAQAESQSRDVPLPIPFRIPGPTGQPERSQGDDPFSDAGLHEAVDITGVEQETEVTGSMDSVGEDAIDSALVDAGKAEDNAMNELVAPSVIDQGPHEQPHEQPPEEIGASTAVSVPTTTETEPVKEETAVLDAFDEDMQTTPLPQVHLQSQSQSRSSPDVQPASPKGKQVEEASAEPARDSDSATPTLNAANGLVTIPIPPHYHKVRNLLWLKKTVAESQPAPRTPSPKKPSKKASGTSGARRTRASKKTPSKAPADADDTWSPPHTRSAKKTAKVASEAATQEASPAPRATPIKRIILHFTRKPKTETDGDAASEPEEEEEEESNQESSQASGEGGMESGSFHDLGADELGADADEDGDRIGYGDEIADSEDEVMLL